MVVDEICMEKVYKVEGLFCFEEWIQNFRERRFSSKTARDSEKVDCVIEGLQ